jgi:hypothetical protein
MSDPEAERKAKAARAKALVGLFFLASPSPKKEMAQSSHDEMPKLNDADLLAGKET